MASSFASYNSVHAKAETNPAPSKNILDKTRAVFIMAIFTLLHRSSDETFLYKLAGIGLLCLLSMVSLGDTTVTSNHEIPSPTNQNFITALLFSRKTMMLVVYYISWSWMCDGLRGVYLESRIMSSFEPESQVFKTDTDIIVNDYLLEPTQKTTTLMPKKQVSPAPSFGDENKGRTPVSNTKIKKKQRRLKREKKPRQPITSSPNRRTIKLMTKVGNHLGSYNNNNVSAEGQEDYRRNIVETIQNNTSNASSVVASRHVGGSKLAETPKWVAHKPMTNQNTKKIPAVNSSLLLHEERDICANSERSCIETYDETIRELLASLNQEPEAKRVDTLGNNNNNPVNTSQPEATLLMHDNWNTVCINSETSCTESHEERIIELLAFVNLPNADVLPEVTMDQFVSEDSSSTVNETEFVTEPADTIIKTKKTDVVYWTDRYHVKSQALDEYYPFIHEGEALYRVLATAIQPVRNVTKPVDKQENEKEATFEIDETEQLLNAKDEYTLSPFGRSGGRRRGRSMMKMKNWVARKLQAHPMVVTAMRRKITMPIWRGLLHAILGPTGSNVILTIIMWILGSI